MNTSIDRKRFNQLIKDFQFKELFNELGWDSVKKKEQIAVENELYNLEAVAEKKSFVLFVCSPGNNSRIPDYHIRKKIDTAITKLYFEHLIIFCDSAKKHQIWQLVVREHGKPTAVRETNYYSSHLEPELLFQRLKGLFFSIDDEDKISIVDVKSIVQEQFNANAEKVTKKFYDGFKREHTAFLDFIKGISENVDKDWYASLMLNRLMFIYFIQKKGFLDNDKDYLNNKLKATQEMKGKNKFYSFYKNFLLILFHKGLGSHERTSELIKEIGIVPYLNGGLFDVHRIEQNYANIEIEDNAFERIFSFFDQYEWHLDTRITATGKDINPDVIGYIFEKYINDRASMGAYYTKEDITDYISKNCIIPYLFNETRRNYPKAFAKDAYMRQMLKNSKDDYIYDAVKYGTNLPLPDEIAIGLDTTKPKLLERRKEWNKPAPPDYALPTEIWREVVERRNRYTEIKAKFENEEITEINDFITYNLNIRQFAQDVIENTDDPDLIRHFYKALSSISILDPTCGSGAFLFASINILEPLYEACIQRMEVFVSETQKGKYKFFEETLAAVKSPEHPNLQYFIFKNIILQNIYGVDIMNEAVEIAKLRLFLKLVATVDTDYKKPNLGLEPLPDIDFNIRAGNTLVGFAKLEEVEKAVKGSFNATFLKKEIDAIKEQAEMVKMAYENFKDSQVIIDSPTIKGAKKDLEERLRKLNDKLNVYQAQLYGVEVNNPPLKKGGEEGFGKFEKWKTTHQPFHWFAEFYDIIHNRGGFDVIIGNPPYVNLTEIEYKLPESFSTRGCNDLFALTIERSYSIGKASGFVGFIIPLSATSTKIMEPLQTKILNQSKVAWTSYYSASDQPASLFTGVRHRLMILIARTGNSSITLYKTRFIKWFSQERPVLFSCFLQYADTKQDNVPIFSKISNSFEGQLLKKLLAFKPVAHFVRPSNHYVYYHNAPVHWGKAFDFIPHFQVGKNHPQRSSHIKDVSFETAEDVSVVICLLNSSLFYWFNWHFSNCRDLSEKDVLRAPIGLDRMALKTKCRFVELYKRLMCDFNKHKKIYRRVVNNITTEFDSFYPAQSKSLLDEIDYLLGEHFELKNEERDFIINYDIKYRMGKELDTGD